MLVVLFGALRLRLCLGRLLRLVNLCLLLLLLLEVEVMKRLLISLLLNLSGWLSLLLLAEHSTSGRWTLLLVVGIHCAGAHELLAAWLLLRGRRCLLIGLEVIDARLRLLHLSCWRWLSRRHGASANYHTLTRGWLLHLVDRHRHWLIVGHKFSLAHHHLRLLV